MTKDKVKRSFAALLAVGALAIALPATSFADGGRSTTTAEPGGGGH